MLACTSPSCRSSKEQVLSHLPWQKIIWRQRSCREGFPLPSCASPTACGPLGIPLPGEEVLILGEERAGGEQKYSACTLPPSTSLITLVEIMKRCWVGEYGHRELKQEVGLSHVKGRLWRALCHHAVFCLLDPGFFQWLRFTQPVEIFGATVPAIRTELAEELPQPVFCSWCRVKPTHPAGS